MTDPSLSGAYALDGPEACKRLYADWAASYDAEFAVKMDFRLPVEVAAALSRAKAPDGPVLDVGAGTGLVAEALRAMGHTGAIDAVDLSRAMLDVAATKRLYRDLIEADVTRPLSMTPRYAGIVSSGTFTHGHVGPEALSPLLDVARPGCVFAVSVNAGVWEAKGFDAALDALSDRIADVSRTEVPIYGAGARATDPDHAADTALILTFRAS